MKFLLSLFLGLCLTHAQAASLSRESALEDLHQLAAIMAEDYGPLLHKRDKLGILLSEKVAKYEQTIQHAPESELAFELVKFAAEFRDAHYNVRLPSREETSLGFTVDLIEGKALIDSIDRALLPETSFPFSLGDELTSLGGEPPLAAAQRLGLYFGMGHSESSKRIGVMALTKRRGRSVPLPAGDILIGIRRHGQLNAQFVLLPWKRSSAPEPLAFLPAGAAEMCNEKSQILPPPGAKIVEGVPFTAFTFATPRGRIGFLRIPHYFPTNALGEEEAALRFEQYEEVVRRFEAETVGLIIDQNYNCGGSILFVNKLVSLFARGPFAPASLRFRASQGQIDGLSRHLHKFREQDTGYSRFKSAIDQIIEAKAKGLFETAPIPLFDVMEVKLPLLGTSTIAPNPVRYTNKPIVVLINELSGSGGDLFPSLMQDLKLARLIGHRTMGAGGHLWDDPHLELKNSHASVNLTRSLIVRLNGELIENEGVRPDSPYELSRSDLLNGAQDYLQAVTNNLLQQR